MHKVSIKRLDSAVSKNILHRLRAKTLTEEDESWPLCCVHPSQVASNRMHERAILINAKLCTI
ncbi:unannotated protein [freshwater metagenome]|uniref:Unannotated protein n=1 Tax=freshwater metagenome TaxID=449393 RepID=A0A6J7GZ44_9ZZZZ